MTKLAAENLCRFKHQAIGLARVVLCTGRFFPDVDDMAHSISMSGDNTRAVELVHGRLTVEDPDWFTSTAANAS